MLISFDPTINGAFVHKVLRDEKVVERLQEIGIYKQEDQHNLVKEVLIAGFRDYEVDFNKLISAAKRNKVTLGQ